MDINKVQQEIQPSKEYYDANFEEKAKRILVNFINERDKIIDELKFVFYRGKSVFRDAGIGYKYRDYDTTEFSDNVSINKNKYSCKGCGDEISKEIWVWLSKRFACFLTKNDREKAKKYFPIPTQDQVDKYWLDLISKNKKSIDYIKKYGENILSQEAFDNVKRVSTLITDFDIFDDLNESVNENLGMGLKKHILIIEDEFKKFGYKEEEYDYEFFNDNYCIKFYIKGKRINYVIKFSENKKNIGLYRLIAKERFNLINKYENLSVAIDAMLTFNSTEDFDILENNDWIDDYVKNIDWTVELEKSILANSLDLAKQSIENGANVYDKEILKSIDKIVNAGINNPVVRFIISYIIDNNPEVSYKYERHLTPEQKEKYKEYIILGRDFDLFEEFIHDQLTEPGPLPDFDHFSSRFPDIASSTNSLSRGETIKDIKTSTIEDDYFKNKEPEILKRGRIRKKFQKKEFPDDDLEKTMKFKEFIKEGHSDISGGFMGFNPAPGNGMYSNPPGEITSALFGQGEYVAGSVTNVIEDPYFASDGSPKIIRSKKIKSRKYKLQDTDRIMKLKEFIRNH